MMQANQFAGVGAGRAPEVIGKNPDGVSQNSGSARLKGR